MANSSPATPKTMSSRLMTMKFMQRAAAASTDAASQPDNSGKGRTPERRGAPSRADLRAFKEAAEIEEAKRVAALERQVRESGETRWTLSYHRDAATEPTVQVVRTGFAGVDEVDAGEDDESDEPMSVGFSGRKSFGGFKSAAEREAERTRRDTAGDDSAAGSEDESSDAEFNLSSPKSRENGSTAATKQKHGQGRTNGVKSARCYVCGVLGHQANICPKNKDQRREKRKALKQLKSVDKRLKMG